MKPVKLRSAGRLPGTGQTVAEPRASKYGRPSTSAPGPHWPAGHGLARTGGSQFVNSTLLALTFVRRRSDASTT